MIETLPKTMAQTCFHPRRSIRSTRRHSSNCFRLFFLTFDGMAEQFQSSSVCQGHMFLVGGGEKDEREG